MKKKIVAMLLIACMSISAAACGKSEEPKEKVKTEAQKETKRKKSIRRSVWSQRKHLMCW